MKKNSLLILMLCLALLAAAACCSASAEILDALEGKNGQFLSREALELCAARIIRAALETVG